MNNFYIYVYLDPRKYGNYIYKDLHFKFEPFYIGKGKKDRCYQHIESSFLKRESHLYKSKKIKKLIKLGYNLKKFIIKIRENLTEKQAFYLEKRFIKIIGRNDKKIGPLTNLTDGGEGLSGRKFSQTTRDKISNAHKGKKIKQSTKNKLRKINSGKILSEITRDKISKSTFGKVKSEFTKMKMRKPKSEKTKRKMSIYQKNRPFQHIINNCQARRKITNDDVLQIKKLKLVGKSVKNLSKKYNISKTMIRNIINDKYVYFQFRR